jgi:hypothetical protein
VSNDIKDGSFVALLVKARKIEVSIPEARELRK